jgi:hypothetical protein
MDSTREWISSPPMEINDRNKKLLEFARLVYNTYSDSKNDVFRRELNSLLAQNEHFTDNFVMRDIRDTKANTEKISKYLCLDVTASIKYDYIDHTFMRARLEMDNLRMENVLHNLTEKDEINRLYQFCFYAFYQIEMLVNWYFHKKYPSFDALLNEMEQASVGWDRGRFIRKGTETDVSDIVIASKLNHFNHLFFNNQKQIIFTLRNLRNVRNEGSHRCSVILKNENENDHLRRFIKDSDFSLIRKAVKEVNKVVSRETAKSVSPAR